MTGASLEAIGQFLGKEISLIEYMEPIDAESESEKENKNEEKEDSKLQVRMYAGLTASNSDRKQAHNFSNDYFSQYVDIPSPPPDTPCP